MTLYIKSQLSDLLVEAAKERSLADALYLSGILVEASKENFSEVLGDTKVRLMCEDPSAAQWLLVDVLAAHMSDEEKAAIAEELNINQLSIYQLRKSAGG